MSDWSPATGDAKRDVLIGEVLGLREELRARFAPLMTGTSLPPDLTMRQLHVLLTIANVDGITVHELSERFDISTPTASGLVDRLADKSLITKVADVADRRVRHLEMTQKGIDTLSQLDSHFSRMIGEAMSQLTHEELIAMRDYSALLLEGARRRTSPPD